MTLLPTLSLLTATTSYILTPSQKSSVREDIKSNIKLFSPFRSGATTLVVILQVLCFRILKIAPGVVTLRLLALQDNSDSDSDLESNSNSTPDSDLDPQICAADPGHTPFIRFSRRSFLLSITIPLYITVLLSGRYEKWILGFTTALLAESIIAEILTVFWISKIEVRSSGDWPRWFLLAEAKDTAGGSGSEFDGFYGRLDYDYLKKSSDESREGNEGHKQGEGQATISQTNTLCEYVERLYTTTPASSLSSTTSTSTKITPKPTQHKPKTIILSKTYPPLKALFTPSQSKCPHHWSCKFHVKIQQLSKIIFYVYAILEPILTTYLLLTSLKTVLTNGPGSSLLNRLMKNNLIFGILATVWDIFSVIFLVLFIYVFFNIFYYVLTTRIRIQDRIQDRIPISISISSRNGFLQNHTTIRAILLTIQRQLFTAGPTYWIIFKIVPVRRLDVEVLSWIIASGFVLGIYFGGYFVVSRVVCDDATGATGTATARKIKEKRFEILRVGVLVPTIVFWGVLFG